MKRLTCLFLLVIFAFAFGQDITPQQQAMVAKRMRERERLGIQTNASAPRTVKATYKSVSSSVFISVANPNEWATVLQLGFSSYDNAHVIHEYKQSRDRYVLYKISCKNNGSEPVRWSPLFCRFEDSEREIRPVTSGPVFCSAYRRYRERIRTFTVPSGRRLSCYVLLPKPEGRLRMYKVVDGEKQTVSTL